MQLLGQKGLNAVNAQQLQSCGRDWILRLEKSVERWKGRGVVSGMEVRR